MNDIKVSILITAYNAQDYLEQCLQSAITQTLHDIEIIAVDNASTDDTNKIIKKYSILDSRVKLIHAKDNHYAGGGRNLGIKVARGEYILFLDSDDTYDKNCAEILYNQAIKYNNDLIVYNYKQYFSLSSYINKMYLNPSKITLTYAINCKITIADWCKFYKRELFTKYNIKFYEDIFCCDLATGIKFFYYAKNIGFNENHFYNYLIHDNSITSANGITKDYINHIFQALEDNKKFLKEKGIFDKYLIDFFERYVSQFSEISRKVYELGDKTEIIDFLKENINTFKFFTDKEFENLKINAKNNYFYYMTQLYLFGINKESSFFTKDKINFINAVNPIIYLREQCKLFPLIENKISNTYIYGYPAAFSFQENILNNFNILIEGLIETNKTERFTNYKYGSLEDFKEVLHNKNIFISSITFEEDIKELILYFKETYKLNINLY